MKRVRTMKKKIAKSTWRAGAFISCMLLTLGLTLPVAADDYTGGSDWAVTFNSSGKSLDSNFTRDQFQEVFKSMQPGDSAKVTLALKNDYGDAVNWYMDNDIISSLEQSSGDAETSGGVYTYQLVYKSPNENTERGLFQSGSVGGEYQNRDKSQQGLVEINDSYMRNYDENNVNRETGEAYFYLDNLKSGQQGTISLYMKLDGETQGNYYQDTLASLQMKFAVDLTKQSTPPANTTTTTTNVQSGGTRNVSTIVKTGDTSNNMLFITMAAAAGVVLLVLAVISMKLRKQEAAGQAEDPSDKRKEDL